jgi:putative tryptophan/tyrosine transport system substrate-binding protein
MRRRAFIAGLSSAAAWPAVAPAQQGERVRRIGMLMPFSKDDPQASAELAAFRQGLAELGWIEGRTVGIEVQWPGGDIERAETLAKELVAGNPDVLLSRSTPTTTALKKETSTIPIVFVTACYVRRPPRYAVLTSSLSHSASGLPCVTSRPVSST